jgi:AcrR family transcriptional regulator
MADHMADQDALSPEKQRQILDGAGAIFAVDGYGGASMSRIAAEAGVSKGTLYNYFDGKKALFTAYVQRECAASLAHFFDGMPADGPPREALMGLGRRMVETLSSEKVIAIYRMVIAEAHTFPELAEVFFEVGPKQSIRRLAQWIETQCRAGRLAVDDPEFAAEQLFALMQTKILTRRRLQLIHTVTPAEIDFVVKAAVDLFLRGYGTAG